MVSWTHNNTAQYNTVQYNTVQYKTIQYSTVQDNWLGHHKHTHTITYRYQECLETTGSNVAQTSTGLTV